MLLLAASLYCLPGATDPHRTLIVSAALDACLDAVQLANELSLRLPDLAQHAQGDGVADLGYALRLAAQNEAVAVELRDPLELPLAETQFACSHTAGQVERQVALFVEDHLRLHRERFAMLLDALAERNPRQQSHPVAATAESPALPRRMGVGLRLAVDAASDGARVTQTAGLRLGLHGPREGLVQGWLELGTSLPRTQRQHAIDLRLHESGAALGIATTVLLGPIRTEARVGYAHLLVEAHATQDGRQSPSQWRQLRATRVGLGGMAKLGSDWEIGLTLAADRLWRAPVWSYRGTTLTDQGPWRLRLGLTLDWLLAGR